MSWQVRKQRQGTSGLTYAMSAQLVTGALMMAICGAESPTPCCTTRIRAEQPNVPAMRSIVGMAADEAIIRASSSNG